MKKIAFSLLLLAASLLIGQAQAYQIFQGPPANKSSDTSVPSDYYGGFLLKQDLIDNLHNSQPTRSAGFAFGRNTLVQNVRCDLWEGPTCTYVFPATPQQMAISSTSANDAAAGTGVQSVYIHYLDTNYVEQTEIVTLNGVTPVNTVATNILRINSLHAAAVGSGGAAAGAISLKNTAGTVTYSLISAGLNTARQAIYTVPAGKYNYISHLQASAGAASGTHFTQVDIRATSHIGVYLPGVFLVVDEIGLLNSSQAVNLPTPIKIAPMSDVKMTALSDASNANVVAVGAIMGWFETQQ